MRITIVGGEILADGRPVAIIMPGIQPTLRGDLEDWLDGYDPDEIEEAQREAEEDAREEGYNSGYDVGRGDGYNEGYDAGYERGVESMQEVKE